MALAQRDRLKGRRRTAMRPDVFRRHRYPGAGGDESDRFAALFPVPPSLAGPKRVFLACHYCGYDPPTVPAGAICPKCGGHSWERFAISRRLLPDHLK